MAGKFICETETFVKDFFKKKKHEFLGSPSLHFSLIKGGRELSTYPEYCEIKLERRVIPGEDEYEIEREFELVLKRISEKEKNFRGNFDIFFFRPPSEISKEEKIVKCLEKAYRMVKGESPALTGLSFWTDGVILNKVGIPTVIFGPTGEGLHSAVEYVDFFSLKTFTEILAQSILEFCGF